MDAGLRQEYSLQLKTPILSPGRRLRSDLVPLTNDLLTVWDAVTIFVAGYVCAIAYRAVTPPGRTSPEFEALAIEIALVTACLLPPALRDPDLLSMDRVDHFTELVRLTSVRIIRLLALLLAVGFLTRAGNHVPRIWMIGWSTAVFIVTISGRLLAVHVIHGLVQAGLLRENVAIVGATLLSTRLLAHFGRARARGVEIVGVFHDGMTPVQDGSPVLTGSLEDLVQLGKRQRIHRAILTLPGIDIEHAIHVMRVLKALDIEISLCPPLIGTDCPAGLASQFAGLALILLVPRPLRHWGTILKMIEDKLLGGLLLVAVLPLLVVIAIAVRMDSEGPVLFRQKRHGWNNTEFEVLKFRTMKWAGVDGGTGTKQTQRNDPRVTRVGAFLRRSSLDELPQLVNVMVGDMSLVGPRPHPVVMRTEDRLGSEIAAEYAHRHRVKPGITGWAQVNGYRGATSTADQVRKRIEHDIYYIEHWSIFLDLKILLLTPFSLMFDDNAF